MLGTIKTTLVFGRSPSQLGLRFGQGRVRICKSTVQYLLQRVDIRLGNEVLFLDLGMQAGLPFRADLVLALDIEVEVEVGEAGRHPKPQRVLGDSANDFGGLAHGVVRLAVLVDLGLKLVHPATEQNFGDESNRNQPAPTASVNQHPFNQADGFFD
jgi:hypothetical protein